MPGALHRCRHVRDIQPLMRAWLHSWYCKGGLPLSECMRGKKTFNLCAKGNSPECRKLQVQVRVAVVIMRRAGWRWCVRWCRGLSAKGYFRWSRGKKVWIDGHGMMND